MEGAREGHEFCWDVCCGILGICTGCDAGILPGELDGAFVCLCTRVAEEYFVTKGGLHQPFCQLYLQSK